MRLLAFDTSGPAISAAAFEGGLLFAHRFEPLPRGHAERLLPMLSGLLAQAGWAWRELDLLAVTVGPGSFTGLRAGIAVARALALGLDCAAMGIGTLQLLAETVAASRHGNRLPIQVLMDARRDELYAQRFSADLEPLGPPEVLARAAVAGCLAPPCLTVVDGPFLARDLTSEGLDMVEAAPDARYLAPAVVRRLQRGCRTEAGVELRPVYLRPPDARLSAGASMVTSGR